MRFLFLNQYGPPDSPPTARLLGELADHLRAGGHDVEIVSQRQAYRGRPARGRGRLKREAAALWGILRAGWTRRTPRPDVVLALSSPPGLLVVAALVAWRQRARLAHWAMDLYPELALALGEVSPGAVPGAIQRAMNWAYRRADLVVALDADMQAHLQPLCRQIVQILEPWPPAVTERQLGEILATQKAADAQDGLWTWLYSGNLGRAHEWRTLLDAQRLLEDRSLPIQLVFQGDGAARAEATQYARNLNLQLCEWKDYVAEDVLLDSLLAARVLIVTQRPETRGLLWPSKLAVMESLPRPIAFVGPVEGAIAERLRARGRSGVFPPGQATELADWVTAQFAGSVKFPTVGPYSARAPRSCQSLEQWLKNAMPPGA